MSWRLLRHLIIRFLVSACHKTQEGYRFASTTLCPFHVFFVILDYLSKGHSWIDCIHTIHLLFEFSITPFSTMLCVSGECVRNDFSFLVYIIALSLVKFNKKSVKLLCISPIVFVKICKFHFRIQKYQYAICPFFFSMQIYVWLFSQLLFGHCQMFPQQFALQFICTPEYIVACDHGF